MDAIWTSAAEADLVLISSPQACKACSTRFTRRHEVVLAIRSCPGRGHIAKPESISLHTLAADDRDRAPEHWTVVYERMELAVFAARIDITGKVGEQLVVKVAPGELRGKLRGINAHQLGTEPGADHFES